MLENKQVHSEAITSYSVSIDTTENGSIVAKPASGPAGTTVLLQVSPEPGFKLKSGSLVYRTAAGEFKIDEKTRSFILPEADVRVGAVFDKLSGGNYSVTVRIGQLEHGIIIADPDFGLVGTQVKLSIIPDEGYQYVSGSLVVDNKPIDDKLQAFSLPNHDVTVQAKFSLLPAGLHSIRVGKLANGRIFPIPENAAAGTEIYLHALADPGYVLKSGSLKYIASTKENPVGADRTFTMPQSHVLITGEFGNISTGAYSAGVQNLAHGYITAEPEYGAPGTPITVRVYPNPGYILEPGSLKYTDSQGKEESIDAGNPSFLMPQDHVLIRAVFKDLPQNVFSVQTNRPANGQIYVSPVFGQKGEKISLQVSAEPGYRLKPNSLRYTDTSGADTGIDENLFSFNLPGSHVTVKAEFETLGNGLYTVQTGYTPHGRIVPMPGYGSKNTSIYLWVTPDKGYYFDGNSLRYKPVSAGQWTSIGNNRDFLLPASHVQVTADFLQLSPGDYAIGIEPPVHGKILLTDTHASSGTGVNITVSPDMGYRIKKNSLRYRDSTGKVTILGDTDKQFIMPNDDITLSAEFEPAKYRITIAQLQNGTITADPTGAADGTLVKLKISPQNGYRFVRNSLVLKKSAGGQEPIDEKTLSFTMPADDISITAQFSAFTAMNDLRINGRPVKGVSDGKTEYTVRIPGQEAEARITFTTEQGASSTPTSGGTAHSLKFFENDPVYYTVTSPDGITKTTYTFRMIRELIPTEAVPTGSFQRDADAANISEITRPFRMGKYEVTQGEYRTVMGYARGNPLDDAYPVSTINWYEAILFCNKLSELERKTPAYSVNGEVDYKKWPPVPTRSGNRWTTIDFDPDANGYRLPTEMEWLWAAMDADVLDQGKINRSGYTYAYAGYTAGSQMDEYAWYDFSDSFLRLGRVKKANRLGIHDMSGNAAEWCWDWYESAGGGDHKFTITGTKTDYTGPSTGSQRMLKGGHFQSPPHRMFLNFRGEGNIQISYSFADPLAETNNTGIRLIYRDE
ncbi:MAG: SUMF1/EgtB/PvdO family nonheme iron enzyme [Treponema sp.]|nr:SUMF1/EgtB/PvdO family nonheme iron enzyme [Treponema sp.]